jgi:hypothetical protein
MTPISRQGLLFNGEAVARGRFLHPNSPGRLARPSPSGPSGVVTAVGVQQYQNQLVKEAQEQTAPDKHF